MSAVSELVAASGGDAAVVISRRGRFGVESMTVSFGVRLALNVLFVYLATVILRGDSSFDFRYGVLFAYLITLIIWLYDYYRPVYDVRFADSPLALHSLRDFVERVRTRQAVIAARS